MPFMLADNGIVAPLPSGGGAFSANAVTFDGTADYFSDATPTTSDSKTFVLSLWMKLNASGDSTARTIISKRVLGGLSIDIRDDNVLSIAAYNSAGTQILEMYTNAGTTLLAADGWQHLLLSVDMAGLAQLYINDADDSPRIFGQTNDTIKHTDVHSLFNANGAGGNAYFGDCAEFWLTHATSLDLSVSANRRKFISALGKPVDLGSDGSTPTGTAPIRFFSGATASWATNKGTGGSVTFNGSLATAATSPSD